MGPLLCIRWQSSGLQTLHCSLKQNHGIFQYKRGGFTCQVDVREALAERRYGRGQRVDGLVCDMAALTEVQLGQVRKVAH